MASECGDQRCGAPIDTAADYEIQHLSRLWDGLHHFGANAGAIGLCPRGISDEMRIPHQALCVLDHLGELAVLARIAITRWNVRSRSVAGALYRECLEKLVGRVVAVVQIRVRVERAGGASASGCPSWWKSA